MPQHDWHDMECMPCAARHSCLQERAPDLLRGPDSRGSLAWWLDKDLLLQRTGLNERAAERIMQHWADSTEGKQRLAQLRCVWGGGGVGVHAWVGGRAWGRWAGKRQAAM